MNKLFLTVAALAAGLLASTAFADDSGHRSHGDRFKEMDANGDGKISRQEATDAAKARFAEMDKNGDGKITADEMTGGDGDKGGHRHWDPAKFIQRADTDGNGSVSLKEWLDRSQERFDRLDKNGDGVITADERQAARDEHHGH